MSENEIGQSIEDEIKDSAELSSGSRKTESVMEKRSSRCTENHGDVMHLFL